MKTKQLNKLTMYLAVEGICDANNTVWQSLVAYASAYADFKNHISNIQTYAQTQTQDITGIAQDKAAARGAMCSVALPIAKAVHAYAVKTGNNTLAKSVDFSMSDLMVGRDVHSRDNCQNIYTFANANVANLVTYGVTAAKLTALTAAIATYNLLLSKPRDAQIVGKTITTNLQSEFDAADVSLTMMDDLSTQIVNPTFASNYANARAIVDAAASHEVSTGPTPPVPVVPVVPPMPTPTPRPSPNPVTTNS
jgi:hypothetical protein